jgi:hypothetical protein
MTIWWIPGLIWLQISRHRPHLQWLRHTPAQLCPACRLIRARTTTSREARPR